MNNETRLTRYFHGDLETESRHEPILLETKGRKLTTIQERQVSYRFYTHLHPYVGQLMRRLLTQSIAGLQAADTDLEPGNVALLGSVQVAVDKNIELSVRDKSRFVLLGNTQATLSEDGEVIILVAKLELSLAAATQVKLPDGMEALLLEELPSTPSVRSPQFNLPKDIAASTSNTTKIVLVKDTQITLSDGKPASIAAGTQVLLLVGTQLTLSKGTPVTLIRSERKPKLYANIFAPEQYSPLVQRPYPVKDLDFTSGGAYSVYNWELFFHVPLTIAIHLSKNQRFAEAQRWFHFLFDPTDDSDGPTPERFWKVRPFQTTDVKKVEEILVNLATGADPTLRDETVNNIAEWRDAPFRPHVIARSRQQAYMYKTVMAYLDNLIAWGDSLFRQDTGESIDEALLLYVLAASILGPRPQPVPKKGSVRPQTYANLRADLKQFGVVLREMEAATPFDPMPFPTHNGDGNERLTTIRSLGQALYFCVPPNDKLLGYWDTVADRLFKIRNSLNFQGIFRQLALFEPPIDPAVLARATAAGLDIAAVVNGLNQPLPLVRFQLLVQKAAEICQEVKALGNSLLAAMEKEDGEALASLRARHERIVLEMVEHVRYAQVQEAIKSREGLLKTLALAVQRYIYYERQLGRTAEEIDIPDLGDLDKESLVKMKLTIDEPEVKLREIEVDIAQDLGASGGKIISSHEANELANLAAARDLQDIVQYIQLGGQAISLLPQFGIEFHFWGLGGKAEMGGVNLGQFAQFAANVAAALADRKNYAAGNAGRINSYTRREQDWSFQSNLAAGEITQIFKQIRAAEIRQAIAELELENHRQQMKNAAEIERFLNEEGTEKTGKKTNRALYAWMKREVKGLYGQCFQFAFDIARKAERALQHELGNPALTFLEFGYLAGKEGLLAGERLYLDIKRMEMAYHEFNQREYELTKHVSLLQLDPLALLQLRSTGRCIVSLPEALFDMDGPGHYFRRIKTVAVSIPCVTGPYASVNCTLTLLKSRIRKTQTLRHGGVYARVEDAEDDRFDDYFGSMQSIVTSSAQNDSGLFETTLRDERYLPFENSGVISEWRLELPADPSKKEPCQFDYSTISDVILHLRYTAREGGGLLRKGAVNNLKTPVELAKAGSVRLFAVRHEFPTEWAKFQNQQPDQNNRFELTLNLQANHYPFWSQEPLKSGHIQRLDILARSAKRSLRVSVNGDQKAVGVDVSSDPTMGNLLRGTLSDNPLLGAPVTVLKLLFEDRAIEDLWIAVTWSG